eukprot:scaffold110230_cov66-Phaeocystis_antarctica.AAC.12
MVAIQNLGFSATRLRKGAQAKSAVVGAPQDGLQGWKGGMRMCAGESLHLARVELLGNLELLAHVAKKLSTVTVPVVPGVRVVCVLLGHDCRVGPMRCKSVAHKV